MDLRAPFALRRATVLAAAVLSLLVMLGASRVARAQPNETNRIHMMAKPAVVRIFAGYIGEFANKRGETERITMLGSGSGFIINSAGYVLTNAHVVSVVKEGDDEAKKKLVDELIQNVLETNRLPATDANVKRVIAFLNADGVHLTNLKRINAVVLQSGRPYPFEIKAYGAPLGEGKDLESGKDVAVLKIEIRNAPTLRLGASENVAVGDHVWVMGFPGAADSEQLDQQSELEPTTNDGSISARKATKDGAPILQTNTNTTHGNSGGPVLNAKGEVIGLLTFRGNTVGGQEVQGFNFIVPIDTANEFVRQAGTDNKPGTVDDKWKDGLEHYWKQEYAAAQKDFLELTALFPDHREAARLVTDCQERIAKGEDKTGKAEAKAASKAALFVVIGLGLFALGLVGVGLYFAMRKKGPPAAVPAQPFAPGPAQSYPPPAAVPGYAPAPTMPMQPPPPIAFAPTVPDTSGGPPRGVVGFGPRAFAGAGRGSTQMFHVAHDAALCWTLGPLTGRVTHVGPGVTIGREAPAADLVVADPQVSSAHAWLGFKGDDLVFVDRGSTNGSLVNDTLVMPGQEIVLHGGDVVALGKGGSVKFQVQLA